MQNFQYSRASPPALTPDAAGFSACITRRNSWKYDRRPSFPERPSLFTFALQHHHMETMNGHAALQMAEAVTKAGGTFDISFFPFSRAKPPRGSVSLVTFRKCRMRKPLPHDKFDIDGKHFFLFLTEDNEPKTCYRSLIRAMSFSTDNKIKLIKWYE